MVLIQKFTYLKIIFFIIFISSLQTLTHGLTFKTAGGNNLINFLDDVDTSTQDVQIQKLNKTSKQNEVNPKCNSSSTESETEQFPTDLFTEEQWKQGAVILHLFGAIYFFTLLGIICNDYFLPCVECICVDLNIPKDVAAATFMATATSMPEFFTNTISTLVTNSDLGLGTIIGSLMFNTLGVAALSGVAIKKSVQLDWWPVTRDCIFYCFNIMVLIIVAWGGQITFTESLIMVSLLFAYYLVMFANNPVMKWMRVFIEDRMNCCYSTRYDLTVPVECSSKAKLPLGKSGKEETNHHNIFVISQLDLTSNIFTVSTEKIIPGDDDSLEERSSLFEIPKTTFLMKLWFFYSWPIKAVLTCCCPNPVTNRRLYPITFLICIALIGANSYLIVWMITIFGKTIQVPDIVMGLTFLAAGSTMPEALSSLISVRKGESGIGVSNALGANSLAILLSLGVPWFVKNCMNYYEGPEKDVIFIRSQGIEFTLGILLASTIALFIIMQISGFRLRRTVGVALFTVYGVFIVLQILIEMNIFFPAKDSC